MIGVLYLFVSLNRLQVCKKQISHIYVILIFFTNAQNGAKKLQHRLKARYGN